MGGQLRHLSVWVPNVVFHFDGKHRFKVFFLKTQFLGKYLDKGRRKNQLGLLHNEECRNLYETLNDSKI